MKNRIFFIFTLVIPLFINGCVTDQQMISLTDKVEQLDKNQNLVENKLDKFSVQLSSSEKNYQDRESNLRSGYADLIAEKSALRASIQELYGDLERANHLIEKQNQEIESLLETYAILDSRLSEIEKYLDFEKKKKSIEEDTATEDSNGSEKPKEDLSSKEDSSDKSDKPALEKKSSIDVKTAKAEEIYEIAKQEFDLGHFKEAMDLFTVILKDHKTSAIADNAAFWIGEIYYRKGEYKRAIIEYQNVIDKYSKGNKVAASYLKQGLAFYKLGSKDNAKVIFETLITKFPGSNESLIAKRKLSSF